ncbi:MAG: D-glycero-beta-D-manno-heptose-7-phosphate kinase [Candidatus Odinarchaeia archaeon]
MKRLKSILSKFKDQHVLVIGDIMVDEYIWGKVERISPEAPVQIVDVTKEELRLGGAGNVIKNLVALGCSVYTASVIGNEYYGKWVLATLKELMVDTRGVFVDNSRPTTKKMRIIASHQQILRLDKEKREFIDLEYEKMIINYLIENIDKFSCILISDYAKGVLTKEVLSGVINLAKTKNKIIIVDPKGLDFLKYKDSTILTPNKTEAEKASKIKIIDDKSLVKAGIFLLNTISLKAILITRGEDGMTLIEDEEKAHHITAYAKEVYDVTGAGDTVLSAFGLSISSGASYLESAQIANLAAGIVVGKIGTVTVTKKEILKEASQNSDFKKILA